MTETPFNKPPSELCSERGFTLSELSKRTGVSQQTLINWYRNRPRLFVVVMQGVQLEMSVGDMDIRETLVAAAEEFEGLAENFTTLMGEVITMLPSNDELSEEDK